jgi:methylitaconate Delta-isomerase
MPIRTQILLSIFGSPDIRQIDGVGGGTSTTSKAIIVGPSRNRDSDVEMLFGQVSVDAPLVDWGGACGNLTAAVGPFAVDQGLIAAIEPITEVAIYSVNTRKRVLARFPVFRGRAVHEGDFAIPGVPGTGARIQLEFDDPAGAVSGHLLPTGKPCERIKLEDGRAFTVSIVDAGNPVVFCHASELGLRGTELPLEIERRPEVLATLETIRSIACERMGIVTNREDATRRSPGLPKIGFVSAPAAHDTSGGRHLSAGEVDLVGRLLTMQTAHRSYMGAGAICTGAAAMVEGTIVNEVCSPAARDAGTIRIGHPQGTMDVSVKVAHRNGEIKIESATISRTARRIMEGFAYVPADRFVPAAKRG